MNVVDSSGWLEYFAEGPNADFFAAAIEATDELIVPTACVYEVFKRACQQRGESDAHLAVALMQQGTVTGLSIHLSLEAARTSMALGIPMAGSIILATARSTGATLWTQDADFADIEGVRYIGRHWDDGFGATAAKRTLERSEW